MAKRGLADAVWALPWIVKLILVIFLDVVFGICRFIDGILQGKVLKAIIGFFWIFYGLGIGWILDLIFVLFNKRPLLF